MVRAFADLVAEHSVDLTELDSAIGDADHGINMDRGMRAVLDKLDATPVNAADELFKLVGMTLVSSVGGASGPLYGTFFLRLGTACGPRVAISARRRGQGVPCRRRRTRRTGQARARRQDDVRRLHPALEALDDASIADCRTARRSRRVAGRGRGRDDTIPMVARKGRASYLGERSAGHQDPGATSAALLFEAAAMAFET